MDPDLITHDLCSQGFHIIDQFLDPMHWRSLSTIAQKNHDGGLFKKAKIGLNTQLQEDKTIRTDNIFWIEEQSEEPAIQAYVQKTYSLAHILNQTLFLCLHELESHFAAYKPGAFYKKHIDQFATQKTRKISCVYYLNEHWEEHFGGELKIYDKKDKLIQTVYPIGNRFICFNSDLAHEVSLTHKTRYSIAGWMKTRTTNRIL